MFVELREVLPETSEAGPDGLEVGGVSIRELAARHGTPLLVLDEQHLRSAARRWHEAVSAWEPGARVVYACKALCTAGLVGIMRDEGLGADVASGGELAVALAGGMPGRAIILHGNNKSRTELAAAVDAGVGLVVVDAAQELELLENVAKDAGTCQPILVRVNPDIEVETHRYIRTGHAGSKFGVAPSSAIDLLQVAAASPHLDARGVHVHLGSQLLSIDPWERVIEWLGPFARACADGGVPIEVLDLGGGLGIRYLPGQPRLTIEQVASRSLDLVRQSWSAHDLSLPELVFEPGRSIVGSAGVTAYRVGVIKRDGPIGYVNVDGGLSDNPRPMLYQAEYRCLIADRPTDAATGDWWIAGTHCESGDVLIEDAPLPDPQPGDVLVVAGTGAYTVAMGSNYNMIPRPAVVLAGAGRDRLLVRRETVVDLLARDACAGAGA